MIPRRVLVESGGVGSSASGLLATRVTSRKGGKRGPGRECERDTFRHTRQGLRVSSSSSFPAALDALIPPGSYSSKRDINLVAHRLPKRAGLNQNDHFFL